MSNISVHNVAIGPTHAWALTGAIVDDFSISDIKFAQDGSTANQDGVHLVGACSNGDIYHIRGVTHDDSISLIAHDQDDGMKEITGGGSITDINIADVRCTGVGAKGVVNLACGDGNDMNGISIDHIHARPGTGGSVLQIAGGPFIESRDGVLPTTDEFTGISASHLTRADGDQSDLVRIENNIGVLSLSDLSYTGDAFELVRQWQGYTCDTLKVDGATFESVNGTGNMFNLQDEIINLHLSGLTSRQTGSTNRVLFDGSGTGIINNGTVRDIEAEIDGTVVELPGTANITLSDVGGDIRGQVVFTSPSGLKVDGGLPPIDVTTLPTVRGSQAYHDGTTGTEGPAHSDGTDWIDATQTTL
ncbi:hypothetical protein C5B90_06440 [Haloferax sp. Atlit-12N]|nr:hypothetical protein C5B90_06440 [Haloferax sp. Atlit-12N]